MVPEDRSEGYWNLIPRVYYVPLPWIVHGHSRNHLKERMTKTKCVTTELIGHPLAM